MTDTELPHPEQRSEDSSEVLTAVVAANLAADSAGNERASSDIGRPKRFGAFGSRTRRAFVTTVDQGFASVSNFAVGIVVARIAGPAGLGAYSIAYTVSLVLATVHRGLIVEPMSIENDARRSDADTRIRAGLAAELALGIVAALALVVLCVPMLAFGQRNVAIALFTLAPFIPFLLVQDYWRWIAFMKARPGLALANDTLFNAVQAGLLILLILGGLHSPSVAIAAWGLGAAAGSVYGLRQFSASPTLRGGVAMVGARWHMSKWLVASGIEGWGTTQAFPVFTGPFIGSAALGGLKAAQSLVAGPANVLYSAGGSIGLPEAAHGRETGGLPKMLRVIRWVTIAGMVSVGCLALVIFVAGSQLLSWIYGPEFAQYGYTAKIIALSFLIQGVTVGSYLTLKVTRRTRRFFNVGFVTFVVSLVTLTSFSYFWGVNGAAYAMLTTAVVTTVLLLCASRMTMRELYAESEVCA